MSSGIKGGRGWVGMVAEVVRQLEADDSERARQFVMRLQAATGYAVDASTDLSGRKIRNTDLES